MQKILLIDGYSIISRAYYGNLKRLLTNSAGTPTNGLLGFMNILYKYLDTLQPDYLMVAFDRKEPTFRHKLFDGYKGTRKPMPEDLHVQVPILKELLKKSGIFCMELAGYEADDLIGTAAAQANEKGIEAVILSGDRDMTQLVSEATTLYIPVTKGGYTETEVYTPEAVMEQYGVQPRQMIDVKALQGDNSDNIPGVPGIGPKTALTLVAKYGSLEEILSHTAELTPAGVQKKIAENTESAKLSRTLGEICRTAPYTLDLAAAKLSDIYTAEAYQYMGELELKSLMKRFDPASFESAETVHTASAKPVLVRLEGADETEVAKRLAGCAAVGLNVRVTDGTPVATLCGDGVNVIVPEGMTADALSGLITRLQQDGAVIVTSDLQSILRSLDLAPGSGYFDACIAAYLINPSAGSYQFEDIARDFLGEVLPTARELAARPDELLALEGSVMLRAYDALQKSLREKGLYALWTDIELPLAFSLRRMEKAGIRCDAALLKQQADQLDATVKQLEGEIYELAGESFNINSPRQLGEILFDKIGLPGGKKTKTGYSTSADVLEKLKSAHPLIPKVLEYRQVSKLYSTYAVGLQGCIEADGRIHGHFNQTIAATGRISSTEPNLQNIPVRMELGRAIRKAFVPADGCVFLDADYSQIELRVLAHLSEDERLIAAYQKDADIHRITASEVFHVPLEEVTPEQRRNAKAVNFGIVYGISAFGLSEDLSISRKEANDYISRYFETYPKVKAYLDRQVRTAKEQGYVTTAFGRIRPIPELKSGNFNLRSFGERVAMNSPIQGTSADIIKLAMIHVDEALAQGGYRARIVLQIHDELLLEVPREELPAVSALLKEKMEQVVHFSVPLLVEENTGDSWFETK